MNIHPHYCRACERDAQNLCSQYGIDIIVTIAKQMNMLVCHGYMSLSLFYLTLTTFSLCDRAYHIPPWILVLRGCTAGPWQDVRLSQIASRQSSLTTPRTFSFSTVRHNRLDSNRSDHPNFIHARRSVSFTIATTDQGRPKQDREYHKPPSPKRNRTSIYVRIIYLD